MLKKLARHEFIALFGWPVIASILSLVLNAEIYLSLFLFFGVPAVYLSYKHPKLIQKSLFFSVLFSVPAAFLMDYVMEYTGGWAIGRMELPPIWFLHYVSFLQIVWLILFTYLIVIYYEVFFDRSVSKVIYPKTKILFLMGLGVFAFLLSLHFFDPGLLYIDHFYFKIGIVAVLLPLVLFLLKRPSLWRKFLKVGAYFFFFTFIYEITALRLGQWSFPATDQFIGHVTILGYSFPIEEVIFWMMLCAMSTLAYYEYFDDDGK